MTKTCKTCACVLPLESFPIGKLNAGGHRPHCKPCYSKITYRARNPEVCARATAKYLSTEKGKHNAQILAKRSQPTRNKSTAAWRQRMRDEGKMQDLHRQYSYGMTPKDFETLKARDAVCAICKRAVTLHIDHDHVTDKIRGRLCHRCNTGLGKLGDNIAGVTRALIYLQERS